MKVNRKEVVEYLHRKELKPKAIYVDLVGTLGARAISHSTVTCWLRETRFTSNTQGLMFSECETHRDECDEAILSALQEYPFASIRALSRLTHLSRTSVQRHSPQSLGYVIRHLHWVPHSLSADQKAKRVAMSGSLLHLLQSLSPRSWSKVTALDKSWFYHENDEEQMWLLPHEKVPERSKHMTQSRKSLMTIAWNADGFHLIKTLPKGMKFNSTDYIHEILTPLLD
jgi:hypothetical protein